MSSRTIRWWWSVLATVGFATGTIALVWSVNRLLVGAGFLLAIGAGLLHERAARRTAMRRLRGRRDLSGQDQHSAQALEHANALLETKVVELEERTRVITLLGQMSDHLQSAVKPAEAHVAIANYARELFPLDAGALCAVDPVKDIVEVVASWGQLPPQDAFARGDCRALLSRRVHVVSGDDTAASCHHVSSHAAALHVCIPIVSDGEARAMVYLRWHPETAGKGNASASVAVYRTKVATAFAEQVGLALTNLRLKEVLRAQALHDPLTGLHNRRSLDDGLHRELLRAARKRSSVGVLMFDLDHFKAFNDAHGHAAGDALLRAVARQLRSDIRAEDIACRYGGEEFVVILADATLEQARMRAEQIREGTREIFIDFHGRRLRGVTVSVGVAVSPDHGVSPDALLRAADAALYAAKASGRDRTKLAAQILESPRVERTLSA